jgi:hypothetical protein
MKGFEFSRFGALCRRGCKQLLHLQKKIAQPDSKYLAGTQGWMVWGGVGGYVDTLGQAYAVVFEYVPQST